MVHTRAAAALRAAAPRTETPKPWMRQHNRLRHLAQAQIPCSSLIRINPQETAAFSRTVPQPLLQRCHGKQQTLTRRPCLLRWPAVPALRRLRLCGRRTAKTSTTCWQTCRQQAWQAAQQPLQTPLQQHRWSPALPQSARLVQPSQRPLRRPPPPALLQSARLVQPRGSCRTQPAPPQDRARGVRESLVRCARPCCTFAACASCMRAQSLHWAYRVASWAGPALTVHGAGEDSTTHLQQPAPPSPAGPAHAPELQQHSPVGSLSEVGWPRSCCLRVPASTSRAGLQRCLAEQHIPGGRAGGCSHVTSAAFTVQHILSSRAGGCSHVTSAAVQAQLSIEPSDLEVAAAEALAGSEEAAAQLPEPGLLSTDAAALLQAEQLERALCSGMPSQRLCQHRWPACCLLCHRCRDTRLLAACWHSHSVALHAAGWSQAR